MRVKFDAFWAFPIHRCPLRTIGAQPWASMRPSESDHSDFEPGPNPSRSIFTERASRADRMALAVKPCSRAIRLISAAGTWPLARTTFRNSMASALAVRVSLPPGSAASASLAVIARARRPKKSGMQGCRYRQGIAPTGRRALVGLARDYSWRAGTAAGWRPPRPRSRRMRLEARP